MPRSGIQGAVGRTACAPTHMILSNKAHRMPPSWSPAATRLQSRRNNILEARLASCRHQPAPTLNARVAANYFELQKPASISQSLLFTCNCTQPSSCSSISSNGGVIISTPPQVLMNSCKLNLFQTVHGLHQSLRVACKHILCPQCWNGTRPFAKLSSVHTSPVRFWAPW